MSKYLVTSALPYINGMKHLGNLAGSLLPADVYARFLRAEDHDVLFICSTDDHGTPAEIGADEQGLDVATYCRLQHERQFAVYQRFGLSFDFFGRTSSPQNAELTQHFYRKLDENGYIEERMIQQAYSEKDQRFLPDRYVVGTCPKCGYDKARGDQCDGCASLLDPWDLVNPKSAISDSDDITFLPTKHLFLRLDLLDDEVRAWVNSHANWPRLTTSIAYKWLDEGVKPRCITRDLSWGVSVPRAGFAGKVFYVWFDAPIGYIGATKEWADQSPQNRDWRAWWYDAPDVHYAQFLAKDNVPFHTIFFPAMVLGTREPWTLASYIKGVNWLTYYGGKFSTSQGRGIFMDQALEDLPADYWRYFLIANAPETDDSEFSWELLTATVNKDLANIYGNFINRTLKLATGLFGSEVPQGGLPGDLERALAVDCRQLVDEYRTHLYNVELRKSVQTLRKLWSLGNIYLEKREPWRLAKTDGDQAALVMRTALNLIRIFTLAARPIIPFTAETVLDAFGLSDEERNVNLADIVDLNALVPGRKYRSLPPLFKRLDDDDVAALRNRYIGR